MAFCEARLSENPAWTDAKFFKALALAKLGRGEEARAVMSLDRHIAICDLPPPAEYGDGEKFRQALAAEICRNPTLGPDPRGKATRDGRQTRHLRQPDAVAIEALIKQIKCAVQDYERQLAASDAGFAQGRPKVARLTFGQSSTAKMAGKKHIASWRLAQRRLLRRGVPARWCE